MHGLGHDFIFALRLMRKRPFASFVIVATLGLGIGVNAAFFASFYGMVMRPLPFTDPDTLISIYRAQPELNQFYGGPSDADLFHFGDSEALEAIGAHRSALFNLRSEGPPERIRGAAVTANLFPLLGASPVNGRTFTAEDAVPGAASVVLISDDLWRRSFGADPQIVGQEIRVDGETAEVVGIMPPGFGFPLYHEMWSPIQIDRASASTEDYGLTFIARLADGESVASAEAALEGVMADLRLRYPESYRDQTVKVRDLHESWMPPVTQVAAVMMLALASLVLLIVCANVANMVMAQSNLRKQEKALRAALGASRLRLARQAVIESVLFAFCGGWVGLVIALWYGDWITRMSSVPIPYWLNMDLDVATLAFAAAITLVTGLGVGLVPGLRNVGARLVEGLKSGGRSDGGTSSSEGRLRTALVIGEYAMAVVVLAGALLMVQAYERLQRAETGFAIDERITLKLSLPATHDESDGLEQGLGVLDRAIEAIAQLPEVRSVAATSFLPIENGPYLSAPIEVEGIDFQDGRQPRVTIQAVDPNYLGTLGVELLDGRPLDRGDYEDGKANAVISQSLAARLWPGEGAIGRRLRLDVENLPWLEIVGVSANVEPGEPLAGIDRRPAEQVYVPISLTGYSETGFLRRSPALIVESSAPLAALGPKLRKAIAVAEPDVPIYDLRSMELVLRQHYFAQHIWSRMFALIAFVALGIAALGAYGVSAYAVTRRLHEIGIRLALGAKPRRLMASVIAKGVGHAAIGLSIGLALAIPMVGAMAGLLYGAKLWSFATLGSVIGLLAFVSLLATLIPARRAATVDPMTALREE